MSKELMTHWEKIYTKKQIETLGWYEENPVPSLKLIHQCMLPSKASILNEQEVYFALLKQLVKSGGFVIIAAFNLEGAPKCSGLPVYRYSKEMLVKRLGQDFVHQEAFNYKYIMPSGDERAYIYTLFKKK